MKNWRIKSSMVAASMFCVLAGSTAWAEQGTPPGELEILKRMIQGVSSENQELRIRVRELEAAMPKQEQAAEEAAKEEGEGQAAMINKYVEFGGAIEIEAFWREDFDKVSESNIRLETAEFDFEAQVIEWVTGTLDVEWDGDEDKITVDETFITIGNIEKYPLFLVAGRLTVPFGISTGQAVSDTPLTITDPLTMEVFEAKEHIVLLGVQTGGFNAGAYVFNGDTNERGGEDRIEHFGATVGYRMENDNMSFVAAIDYISSVFDSDGLTEAFPEALESKYEPGIAPHVQVRMVGFSIVMGYNGALDRVKFTADDEAVSIKPEAWNVEVGYITEIGGKETYFALGYSQTDELAGVFPESRIAATVGIGLFDGLGLAFEYVHDEDYDKAVGGTGKSAYAFTAQLGYEW